MKYWQYVVTCVVVMGCSNEPVPEDSYFITADDYIQESAGDLEVSISVDTMTPAVLPDSFPVAGDSLVLPEDTLCTEPDSLESDIDSLPPAVPPEAWRFIEIEIHGSLYQSLGEVSDVDPDILGAHCVRNLVWEMNPWRGFTAGDSMRIIYTTEELSRESMVIAFEYIPVVGSSNHRFSGFVFLKSGDNWPSVWKADGSELVKLLDRAPVTTFEEITSVFGEPRGDHVHQGVDYKAPQGTPVFSVTGGTVLRTNWNTAYNGHCIEIDFGGYSEIFLHMETVSVAMGSAVQPGDQVGTVGNTGISTAAHLHYQINGPDDYAIDPYLYFSSHRRNLGSDDLVRFQEHVNLCREMMGD
ncbi:MAG: M23 family metallopeptidase [Candidatus Fermentibacteria bacterium]|nr:M23 family metallopeptidase [Candidatus Fermentibacteria bacterium]